MSNEVNFSKINVNLELTKDDYVTIAVARHEQQLLQRKAVVEGEIKYLNGKIKEATNDRNDFIDAVFDARFKTQFDEFVTVTKRMGFDKVSAKYSYNIVEDTSAHDYVDGTVVAGIGGYHVQTEYCFDLTSEAKVKHQLVDTLKLELLEKIGDMRDIAHGLSNLDSKERQARAALAIKILKDNPNSSAILESLLEDTPLIGMG